MRIARKNAPGRVALLAALACLASPASASLTGVCPDGSMFIVKHEKDIPCDRGKVVEPSDMPPIKPQYLPRPYGWEKFQRSNDPNNPYNLVTDIREQRREPEPPAPPPPVASPPPPGPRTAPAPPPPGPLTGPGPSGQASGQTLAVAPPPAPRAPTQPRVSLSADELRDLALIVEMSQQVAPATLRRRAGGEDSLVLRFAHSPAFEARLRDAWVDRVPLADGPVLLFAAHAEKAEEFWANLTFVQGHVAFHPKRTDASQLGVLAGRLGALASGESVLGYAVLPPRIDLQAPIDIYWNDHQLTARLLR